MAAIYSGIHLKLKNPRTPWEDKLKLARFAWISSQCLMPNKEQVLFDWTSHALTCFYSKKAELPQDVVEGLWTYLDDILHSRKLQNTLSQGKTISLRLAVAQVIIERIQEYATSAPATPSVSVSRVLSCCQGILASPVLAATFTTKYELLVDLLAKLCSLACSRLQHQPVTESPTPQTQPIPELATPQPQPIAERLAPQVFEALLQALTSYLAVQKQQANSNRVFSQVTAHLLQPLLLLRHLLSTRAWTPQDDPRLRQQLSRDIRSKLDAVLHSALFLPEHLPAYREELLPAKEDAGTGSKRGPAGKGVLSPVNAILAKLCAQGYCEAPLHYAVRSSSLPLLFRFCLEAYCKSGDEKMLCFHLLTRLVTGLDLDLRDQPTVREVFQHENWTLALLALENLLNLCLTGDLYNVAADKIKHGEAQLSFYRKVVQLLFDQAQPGIAAWYRCLKALLGLNHMILDPDLDELLSIAWVDSRSQDSRVRKAREALVSAVLQTYTKLRQLPRLFQELLNVVCCPAADRLRLPLLPEATHRALGVCLLDTPASQSMEVCSLVLESIQTFILPDVAEDADAALKLFSLSGLLFSILFSLKTLDGSTPVPVVRQSQRVMEDMLQVVKAVLELVPERPPGELWVEKTQEAGHLLRYTWVEVDTLFQIHCSKYTSPGWSSDPSQDDGQLGSIVSLLSGTTVTSGDQTGPADHGYTPMSSFLVKLLTLQQMKKVLLKDELLAQSNASEVLCKAAQSIVWTEDHQLPEPSEQLWDGQITSVDASSYPVAHWTLVTSNLTLLAPYLSEVTGHLAGILLSSLLLQRHGDSSAEKHLSVPFVSRQLLESLVLVEMPPLYSAFVRTLTRRITGVLGTSDTASVCPALRMFTEGGGSVTGHPGSVVVTQSEGDVSEIPPAQKRLVSIAQELLSSSKAGASLSLSDPQTEELLRILEVTRALNADGMSSEDFSELFLLLFIMTIEVQPHSASDPAATVQLLGELLSLMAALLTGRNAQCVLKIVHGSSLLEAVMMALFSHSSKGLFRTLDSSDWLACLRSLQDFIRSLVHLIIHRKCSVRLNLEKFTSFLLGSEVAVGSAAAIAAPPDAARGLFSLQLLLACLTSLGQAMSSALGKSKPLDETLSQLLGRTVAALGPAVQTGLQAQTGSLLGQAFSVDVVTGMVRSQLASSPQEGAAEVTLSHMPLYRSFSQQILRELSLAPRPMDFLVSSLHFLAQYYCAVERSRAADLEQLFVQVLQNVNKLLAAPWLSCSEVAELEEPVEELLRHLLVRSTTEQFHLLLLLLRDGLDTAKIRAGRHREVLSAVILTRLLGGCLLPEACSKALWLLAPQLISALVFIVKESGQDAALTSDLTVPALTSLTTLLRQGEGVLSNPHHVTTVLGALQFAPLDHLSPPVYHASFRAVHEALFAIVQCHPQVMLKAAPSFLNVFYRLVASVIQEGRQKGEADRGGEGEEVLRCAMLVERMYSHIAATSEGFTVLSSFIIAQYVSELQKVTLRPDVKSHLTEGVYRILDLCVEHDLKFLTSSLQMGVREVFNELYSSYTHYHKTQRQGEEKYAASTTSSRA